MKENTKKYENLPDIRKLWKKTKGDSDIKIAVLDGPVDLQHESLKNSTITSLDNPIKKDIYSVHGTFVSSLIFSSHKSEVLGIAPECSGITKSIYQEDKNGKLNNCSQTDIEQGILDALEHGAHIINISGGERLNDGDKIIATLANTLDECEKRGVLVIAATGNEGDNRIHIPANYPTVLAVGSIKNNGTPSIFSNWSTSQSHNGIVAPGENILGAIPGGKNSKAMISGTSFSTALVSGVAGLLASLQKQYGVKKDLLAIRKILLDSATPCSNSEGINCDRIMNGRLDIIAAMDKIQQTTKPASEISFNTETKSIENKTFPICGNSKTQPQNLTNINNVVMKNETEVMPSSTSTTQSQVDGEQVAPSAQTLSTNESKSVAESPTSVAPSMSKEHSEHFNPALNQGDYPTWQNCQLVNAIGQPSYDFGTQNNLDTFTALIRTWYEDLPEGSLKSELTNSPHDHKSITAFLLFRDGRGDFPNIFMGSQLIWLLNMNATPTYSISPDLAVFNNQIYGILEEFLADNVGIDIHGYSEYTKKLCLDPEISKDPLPENVFIKNKNDDDVMRMVLPGYVSGTSKLMNGNHIQSVTPVAYGLKNWTVNALVKTLNIDDSVDRKQLISILNRLYLNTLNKGQSADERALNYSVCNIIELSEIVAKATKDKLQFHDYKVVPSKISRQNSISREVQLTFFDPMDTNKASTTYSMQIDVSGVTPIIIGEIQEWQAPTRVTTL